MIDLRLKLRLVQKWIKEEEALLERYLAMGMHSAAEFARGEIDKLKAEEAEIEEQLKACQA